MQTSKSIRIVIDTNLWISFLISKRLNWIDNLIFHNSMRLITSQELLNEFVTVVNRPKFANFFNRADIEKILLLIASHGDLVIVTSKIDLCRDLKDNFLLSLAVDGKADFLVTGDKDLLELVAIDGTSILTISELENYFKK